MSSDDAFADEIVEIFVEEVGEVLGQIDSNLPVWESNPSNPTALKEVRRAFHTLKGSGRMVQAEEIGELAWSVESMLNRVIDGTLKINPAIFELVKEVRSVVPAMITAFQNKQSVVLAGVNTTQLIEQAANIVAGKAVAAVRVQVPKLSPEMIHEEKVAEVAANSAMDMVEIEMLKERISELSLVINELKRNYVTMSTQLDSLNSQVKMMPKAIDPVAINKQLKNADQEIQELKYFIKASSEKMMSDVNDTQRRLDVKVDKELRNVNGLRAQLESEMEYMGKELRLEFGGMIKKWAIGSALISSALVFLFVLIK